MSKYSKDDSEIINLREDDNRKINFFTNINQFLTIMTF